MQNDDPISQLRNELLGVLSDIKEQMSNSPSNKTAEHSTGTGSTQSDDGNVSIREESIASAENRNMEVTRADITPATLR